MRNPSCIVMFCCVAMAQVPPTGSITGEVRDPSGKALSEVRLVLTGSPKGRQTTQSGAQGEFTFPELPAARYQLTAQGVSEVLGTKSVILDAGQAFKVVMTVTPSGSISGRVLDETGEPVTSGFNVALFSAVYEAGLPAFQPQNVAQVDKDGKYSLAGVKAGRSYRVLATNNRPQPPAVSTIAADPEARQTELAQAWFPAAGSPDQGESLVLFPGERRENIDIHLSRRVPRCIEAQVESGPGPGGLYFQIEDEHAIPLSAGNVPEHGRIRFCTPERAGIRLSARKGALSDLAMIAPGDRDISNLRLRPQSAGSVAGVVELEGAAPTDGARMSVGTLRGTEPVDVRIPGAFSLAVNADTPVLSYDLRQAPAGYYVKGAACGGVPVVARRLPLSCSPELRITVARDGGTLSVQVQDADGKPVPDVWVVATPAGAASELEMSTRMWGGPVDAFGAFASSIAPGKYLVIATTTWLDLNTESVARFWRARSKATEVEIGPNASVNLRLQVTKVD